MVENGKVYLRLFLVTFIVLIFSSIHPFPAISATIPVKGNCTLADAINAANLDTAINGCPAGSPGADTIVLTKDVKLHSVDNTYISGFISLGDNGLPVVKTPITILGQGHTIERGAGAPNFRIFLVEGRFGQGNGALKLRAVTIKNGLLVGAGASPFTTAEFSGGAIFNLGGEVEAKNSIFSNNHADNGGAILNFVGGQLHLSASEFRQNGAILLGGALMNIFSKPKDPPDDFTPVPAAIKDSKSHFSENAARFGGAVANQADAHFADSHFYQNEAEKGGAVSNQTFFGQATFVNVLFDKNKVSFGSANPEGGAIYNNNAADLTLRNSRLTNNIVDGIIGNGGGISNEGSTATLNLIDSEVSDNASGTVSTRGGGIYNDNGDLFVTGSRIERNGSGNGGGIYSGRSSDDVEIVASTISENTSRDSGGGIFGQEANIHIERSSISENWALRKGGGIGLGNSTAQLFNLNIQDSDISGNRGIPSGVGNLLQGGGIYTQAVDVTIDRSTISNNVAAGGLSSAGAGIFVQSSFAGLNTRITVRNSTLSGNDARPSTGGALHIQPNAFHVELIHSTIFGNFARNGAGIQNISLNVNLIGTIIAGNTATAGTTCNLLFPLIDGGGNLSDEASCGLPQVTLASLVLGALADNGGATKTHALGAGSSAIDNTGASCAIADDEDQRSAGRDTSCDTGAFEAGPVLPTISFTANASSVTEGTDANFDLTLRLDNTAGNLSAGTVKAWLILGGTSAYDSDYTALTAIPVEITVPAAGTSVDETVSFDLTDDADVEGTETLVATMVFSGPAQLGTHDQHTVTIFDNDFVVAGACEEFQSVVQANHGDENPANLNHGQYVSPVALDTNSAIQAGIISGKCGGCIISQFAGGLPVADQKICTN